MNFQVKLDLLDNSPDNGSIILNVAPVVPILTALKYVADGSIVSRTKVIQASGVAVVYSESFFKNLYLIFEYQLTTPQTNHRNNH